MHPQLETERLLLRPFHINDVNGMLELYADPDVQRFTGDTAFKTPEQVKRFIDNYTQYTEYRMGRLSVLTKEREEYIGWCGLKFLPERNEVEIGYRLIKRYRGYGYATEAAKECLRYGFEDLSLEKIIGMAMKDNVASINVFDKLGLKYDHDETCGEQPGVIWSITKEQWK